MPLSALQQPTVDPTPIFEHFRGSYGSDLLTAAIAHFDLFGCLAEEPLDLETLALRLKLDRRPARVLITALRAMGLLQQTKAGALEPTALAVEHLTPGAYFSVADYVGLAAQSPGVLEMVDRLRSNRPTGADDGSGAAFIYREGIDSAMEQAAAARHFTLALAGRAKNVAPVLAERLSLEGVDRLLDVGAGTGIYSIALLQKNPQLQVVLLDRSEVLKVAREMADAYGVAERIEFLAADMFEADLPQDCQAILLSNILHDWDEPANQALIARCAAALPPRGRLLIHDVFLDDDLAGPLPIALYSAALFTLTEGRAYSAGEYRQWMKDAGLAAGDCTPTLIHCGLLEGVRTASV
ncbi:methyltransferase [Lignipirellula cremea]|uniref:Demethylspheroidene O-methyltransferase n=1 Tax=Lignipirellula cremea TaxID=2528010 RepID=A0A518DWU7_9BACT|nr:methyltransferase [Lignipirellula cremea]QDU96309.1 Demethylspheroidene O-methyltransferase [Lignipirellula cremea]